MKIESIRKEIQELRNSLRYKFEPVYKAFILGADDSPTEEEIEAFKAAHPHTHVILLYRKDCGERSTE